MTATDPAYDAVRRDGVLRIERVATEWLSTGWSGGRWRGDCAYNVTVPDGWDRTDLGAYVDDRLERAGFDDPGDRRRDQSADGGPRDAAGPVLLTGVDQADARGARCGSVTAYATAGVSNPAALPMEPTRGSVHGLEGGEPEGDAREENGLGRDDTDEAADRPGRGTVNVVVGTTRALAPGALANLIAVAAEAKAATLLAETGFPGTTTDAIVAGHDPSGERTAFSGSATAVGEATRACVRDAVRASLRSHYADGDETVPESVADATHGVSTDVRADVFEPPVADRQ